MRKRCDGYEAFAGELGGIAVRKEDSKLDGGHKLTFLLAQSDDPVLPSRGVVAIASLPHQAAELVHQFVVAGASCGQYPGPAHTNLL